MSLVFKVECPFTTSFGCTESNDIQVTRFLSGELCDTLDPVFVDLILRTATRITMKGPKVGKVAWDIRNKKRITSNLMITKGATVEVEIFSTFSPLNCEDELSTMELKQILFTYTLFHVRRHKKNNTF